jgi:hypothetical protein
MTSVRASLADVATRFDGDHRELVDDISPALVSNR